MNFPRKFPRRGEVYWAPADKVRPVVVVSNDTGNRLSNQVVAVAITSTVPAKQYPVNVHLPAGAPLTAEGTVLCASIYTFKKTDLKGHCGNLTAQQMLDVDRALAVALGLPKPPT